ncbi:MAG: DUF2235 domain-containing protein [Campylobacteraceae bacterium]|jgi:hypothetical protein|nr:DUF2235 domain-containing protein [Campylobacteraceae bacterium]
MPNDTTNNTVRIGVFFDGTGAHKDNDIKIGDGVLTNVGKLYELYEKEFTSLYEPGVGTIPLTDEQIQAIKEGKAERMDYYGKSDMAFGSGAKNISENMMGQINEKINKIRETNPNAQILVDVYGFSRGAAIARDFMNSFNEKYKNDNNANIDFAGLYDTVASVGTKHNIFNGGLNLNLNEHSANKIVQFTAKNELRTNFPLHSLKDKDSDIPNNIVEKSIYGAHADVGGGYANIYHDNIIKEQGTVNYIGEIDKARKIENLCEDAKDKNYERVIVSENDSLGFVNYQCVQKEEKTNELGIVGLHAMMQEISNHEIKFKDLDSFNEKYPLPEQFQEYANAISNNEDISRYENNLKGYISQSGRSLFPGIDDVKEDSFLIHLVNAKRDEREVFNNNPDKAVSNNALAEQEQQYDALIGQESIEEPTLMELMEATTGHLSDKEIGESKIEFEKLEREYKEQQQTLSEKSNSDDNIRRMGD